MDILLRNLLSNTLLYRFVLNSMKRLGPTDYTLV